MKRLLLCLALFCSITTTLAQQPHKEEVRNLILLIGDGMGLAQVSMLMIENGYEATPFDRAQNVVLMSTHAANNRVTDSAAAGTALAAGCKTKNTMIGVTPDGVPCESMMAKATRQGLATGVVVTCYLHHATPAAFYAHLAYRGDFDDAAQQMLDSDIDLLLGGGRKLLAKPAKIGGNYFDAFAAKGYCVVSDLSQIDPKAGGRVLGAFSEKHMPHADQRDGYLPKATSIALELLSTKATQTDKGFLLMVEGSLIDYAGHETDAKWLLDEVKDFAQCVEIAMNFADRTPGTLVVVAADHETGGLTIPSQKADYERKESGITYKFSTRGHTGTLVPVYLYGTGAERINGVLDNTALSRQLMEILELK